MLDYRPRPPGHLRPDLAVEWDAVTSCCLPKDPAQRYASALDLERAIDSLFARGGQHCCMAARKT